MLEIGVPGTGRSANGSSIWNQLNCRLRFGTQESPFCRSSDKVNWSSEL